uniref:Chlorophyll a-b binding protein, chloroplastic n=1 Tax=Chlamydomonas euryale TaxID=1486919 RepID=A0A7R9VUJ3_9CHLO
MMQKTSSSMLATRAQRPRVAGRTVVKAQATDKLWVPGAARPSYLDGKSLAGDYGFDPMGFGADPVALKWYRQAELMHARWAMLGVAGILAQEVANPDQFWYTSGLPENLPEPFNRPEALGGLLAFEFCLMHWVEVRRWMDYKNPGSVNQDPVFTSNKLSNPEMGYPGFDPLGFYKGDMTEMKTKEIKNGRLAMFAFVGFTLQAQATGKGPLASLGAHLANPFGDNIGANIGHCVTPSSANIGGLTIPLTCLWPGHA